MSERMSDIRHFAKVGARVVANAQGADLDEEAFLELYDDALAAHDREVAAKALEDAAESGQAKMFSRAVYVGPTRLKLSTTLREWLYGRAASIRTERKEDQ